MKKLIFAFVALFSLLGSVSRAQTYLHPTTGLQSTYCGACMVSTCSGTYRDNGNTGNYSSNINNIYRTFCPNTAGRCLRVTFSSFDVEQGGFPFYTCYDRLYVKNGPTQNSTDIWSGCGTAIPGPFTSTDPSGCLTFRFTSDGSVTRAGWTATFSCVNCAGGPNGTDNNDCPNATQVCSNASFTGASSGPGITSEGCSGCNISENFSNWYAFTVSSSGTLGLTIDPINNADDYDFALYGPNVTCGSLGSPLRCSYAANTSNTGMNGTAGDVSEDVNGNGWVQNVNVTAGQTYYLMINKWSAGGSGFNLLWSLTGGASLDCTPLSAEVVNLQGQYIDGMNELTWTTGLEVDFEKFVIQKLEGSGWIEKEEAMAGGSNSEYVYWDPSPAPGLNIYRLKKVNKDGSSSFTEEVEIEVPSFDRFNVYPNPASDVLTVEMVHRQAVNQKIRIIDMVGRVQKEIPVRVDADEVYLKDISVSNLQPGMYILQFGDVKVKFTKE